MFILELFICIAFKEQYLGLGWVFIVSMNPSYYNLNKSKQTSIVLLL